MKKRVFFTADTHLGHGNIIKYCSRPFLMDADKKALEDNGGTWHNGEWKGSRSSPWRITREAVELMDDTIINNINEMVEEDDILWHLGDFAFGHGDAYIRNCENYRRRIRCKNVNIIWGNHDESYLIHHLFNKNHDLKLIDVSGTKIVLCHYALAVWEKSYRGNWQLYGHSHTTAEPWLDKMMPGRRSLDVGVDNAYLMFGKFRPFSFEELQKLFSKREGFSKERNIS